MITHRKVVEEIQEFDAMYRFIKYRVSHNSVPIGRFELRGTDTTAEIYDIYILPKQRGKGLSNILMEDIQQTCKELGYKTIVLSFVCNPIAIHLYSKSGFEMRKANSHNSYHFIKHI